MSKERTICSVTSCISTSKSADECLVKGFMSVELLDRHNEIVLADEFKIDSFMAKPVLLYNHKLWYDGKGNEIPIGTIKEMTVSYVETCPDDLDCWLVKDKSGKVLDKVPKSLSPDLSDGVKGVWVVAKVTVPEVWKLVEEGSLAAFSWRGLSSMTYKINSAGDTYKVLSDIDLFEVSLVPIPANAHSAAMIAKNVGDKIEYEELSNSLVVHGVKFNKTQFTKEKALSYLKAHDLDLVLSEDNTSYFSLQKQYEAFSENSFCSIKWDNGVTLIAGTTKTELPPNVSVIGVRLSNAEMVSLASLSTKEQAMSEKDKSEVDKDISKNSDSAPKTTEAPKEEVKQEVKEEIKNQAEAEKNFELLTANIAAVTSKSIATELTPVLSKLAETIEGISKGLSDLNTKVEALKCVGDDQPKKESLEDKPKEEVTQEKVDSSKNVGNPNHYGQMLLALSTLNERLRTVEKSVPNKTVRDEKIESAKSNDKADQNKCFDSILGFLSTNS